ncbi:LOW QUALITY PROTEIN: vomeronasal type-1 receptor 2-like [Dugong dugon]
MASVDLKIGIIFLFQIVVGIFGNFSLWYHYVFFYFSGYRSKSTDLIISHKTVTNSLVILSRGIPETMAAFGLKDFLRDFGCKFVVYVHRVGRGVSIIITCLLSIFQAITICPKNSTWAEIKVQAPKHIRLSSILCILHILVNIAFPVYVTGKWNNKNITYKTDFPHCSAIHHNGITISLYATLIPSPDILCLGLMLWASGSMVFILNRHKKWVQHIHWNNLSLIWSPETKATQSILVLVSTFVFFYTLFSIIYLALALYHKPIWWLMNTSALINICFPTVSRFVLMSRDPCVSKLHCVCYERKTKFLQLIRKI